MHGKLQEAALNCPTFLIPWNYFFMRFLYLTLGFLICFVFLTVMGDVLIALISFEGVRKRGNKQRADSRRPAAFRDRICARVSGVLASRGPVCSENRISFMATSFRRCGASQVPEHYLMNAFNEASWILPLRTCSLFKT